MISNNGNRVDITFNGELSARAVKVIWRLLGRGWGSPKRDKTWMLGVRQVREPTFADELRRFTADDLLSQKNCGTRTLNEIRAFLGRHGLALKGESVNEGRVECDDGFVEIAFEYEKQAAIVADFLRDLLPEFPPTYHDHNARAILARLGQAGFVWEKK